MRPSWLPVVALLVVVGCRSTPPPTTLPAGDQAPDGAGAAAPTAFTIEANAAVARALPLDDAEDFADARRGLVAADPDVVVARADGTTIVDTRHETFLADDAPASVNPSLWRQSRLVTMHGLFEVAQGIHQVRGYDVSNLSIITGATGWIVVDPLTSVEAAAAAMQLARRHLGHAPVTAVIFTHSHVDHFGGVSALFPDGVVPPGVRIVAPAGFVAEATSENVLAGTAMGRRATYQFGRALPRGPRGHVSSGLGRSPAAGTIGIAVPTDHVDHTPQELVLDGVRFVFQYTPESEAPAELAFYLPDHKAYCGAEIVSHTLHNLLPFRGAKVRDALRWSGYIDEAVRRFPDAEVVFASHHWPVWGNARVVDYLKGQRDTYKFIHDQTLRLANRGLTPQEIAETLTLPESLARRFANRGYYGTVRHDAKAVYQMYFGWYDGNPAHLDPLPPEDAGRRYVDAMGGAAEVLRKAQAAYDRGEYRWASMLLDHLVFAAPDDAAARALLAQTYDQLGYQQEAGTWRDSYLTAASELRHGPPTRGLDVSALRQLLVQLPPERYFDAMAARLDAERAAGVRLKLNVVFTDLDEIHVLTVENSVLHHHRAPALDPEATATMRLTRAFLVEVSTGRVGLRAMVFSDEFDADGSRLDLLSFFSMLDRPDGRFAIVTP